MDTDAKKRLVPKLRDYTEINKVVVNIPYKAKSDFYTV